MDNRDIAYVVSFKEAVRSVIKHGMRHGCGLCRELHKAGFEDSYFFMSSFMDGCLYMSPNRGEFTDIRMTVLLILNKLDPATVLYFRAAARRG